jgi:predicted component of type VI protein secretion system
MDDVAPDALASQVEQLLRELTEIRKELAGIRAAQIDLSSGQTALAQALLHIKRDGVIKDILARIDGQVRKLEEEKGRVEES